MNEEKCISCCQIDTGLFNYQGMVGHRHDGKCDCSEGFKETEESQKPTGMDDVLDGCDRLRLYTDALCATLFPINQWLLPFPLVEGLAKVQSP